MRLAACAGSGKMGKRERERERERGARRKGEIG